MLRKEKREEEVKGLKDCKYGKLNQEGGDVGLWGEMQRKEGGERGGTRVTI